MRGRSVWAVALALALGAALGGAEAQERGRPVVSMQPIPNDVRYPERPLARSQAPTPARPTIRPRGPAGVVAVPPPPPPLAAAPPPSGPLPRQLSIAPVALETFVDGAVRYSMRADRIAGVTVSVVQDGQIVLVKGYGVADLEPARAVDPNRTLFRIASISKTFTWLLMAQQIEAGRYTLDTPINTLLPEDLRVPDQGFREPIRVRHLMTHSAGFEDKALGHLFEDKPDGVRPRNAYLAEERPRRVRPPGQYSVYSNYGVGLAGAIVERVGGRPFEVLLQERLLQPLGMAYTTVREPYPAREGLPAPMAPRLALNISDGFSPQGGGFKAHGYEYITHVGPAGGMSSTAGDMARYMLAILNGGVLEGRAVFGPQTTQALRTPLMRHAPYLNGWAYGFNEYTLPGGLRGIGHGGDTTWFHSDMLIVPELRLGVFVSTNSADGYKLAGELGRQIVGRFYGGERLAPRPGSPALKEAADAYAGQWISARRAYNGLERFVGNLVFGVRTSVTEEGRLLLSGGRPGEFVPEGEAGRFIRADGADMIRVEMADGRAVRIYPAWGGTVLERAPFLNTPNALVLFAGLALAAGALAVAGPALRWGREVRPTGPQALSDVLLIVTAFLWFVAAVLLGLWAQKATADASVALYDWPSGVGAASWTALLASLLTFALLVLLWGVWRPADRRSWGWSAWRKLRHTLAVLSFAALALVLLLNGGLEPWSG